MRTMTGFKGRFAVNFEIPEFLGLSKYGSPGFGTTQKVGMDDRPIY